MLESQWGNMGDYDFGYYYSISGPGPGANINDVEPQTVDFTIADGDTLVVGEGIDVFLNGSAIPEPVTYQGISDAGEPFFQGSGGQWYFASDTLYGTQPPGNVPTRNEEAFFCFLAGTLIATPEGQVAVEMLAIGDLILTSDGRAVPAKWIGRQTHISAFGMLETRRPVIITADALGENLPVRDLRLTADHAIVLDGLLVQAGALVNGTTIRHMTSAELGERFVVYHIETEHHETVVAEGMAAETFVDNVSRRRFHNYAEYESLYGTPREFIVELDMPRVKSARQLPAALRSRVASAFPHTAEDAA